MIFEIFMGLMCSTPIWIPSLIEYIDNKPYKQSAGYISGEEIDRLMGPTPTSSPVLSDEVELITELLNQDDGWKSLGHEHVEHNHGVRVRMDGGDWVRGGHSTPKYARVTILDENQIYQGVTMNRAETKHVTAKFKAFIARQEANKQRDLGKVLAARIVSGATVGQPAGPEPAVDNVAGAEAVPTLHWDKVTQSIVANGRDGTKQLVPTNEFKKRYGLGDEAQSFRQLGFVSCEQDGVTTWYNPKYVNEFISRPEHPKSQYIRY